MRKIYGAIVCFIAVIAAGLLTFAFSSASTHTVSILAPKGIIASEQRKLLAITALLSIIVVVPVFLLTAFIAWKYRATNKKADYKPNWDSNRKLELLWWGIPGAIIGILAVITWQTSHTLDPFQPLHPESNPKHFKIQVVALQWKWLFIYPEQHIASVNYLKIPTNTPIDFEITSDAPMNSFWIPELGGQIYAMSGMTTHLHLEANKSGDFQGRSANISGAGFSDMTFTTSAKSMRDFDAWVKQVRQADPELDQPTYAELSKPGTIQRPIYYSTVTPNLFDAIVGKYMEPSEPVNDKKSGSKDYNTMQMMGAH